MDPCLGEHNIAVNEGTEQWYVTVCSTSDIVFFYSYDPFRIKAAKRVIHPSYKPNSCVEWGPYSCDYDIALFKNSFNVVFLYDSYES